MNQPPVWPARKANKKERRQLIQMQKPKQKQKHMKMSIPNGIQGAAMAGPSQQQKVADVIDDDNAADQMNVAETYADYKPAKLQIGKPHPDAVVETSSLSSVDPADITYQLSIPEYTIETGKLSALQLESIVYASQAHEQLLPDGSRAGFLIGEEIFFLLFLWSFDNFRQQFGYGMFVHFLFGNFEFHSTIFVFNFDTFPRQFFFT